MTFNATNKMNIFSWLSVMMVSTVFLSGCMTEEETKVMQKQVAAIALLQSDMATLQKQVAIINRNQQAIAQKVGLAAPAKQPSLTVGKSASLGAETASVVLLEFTDLHCPYCDKFHAETFPQLMEKYIEKGQLRFVGKHLPIPQLHPNAFFASQLLECSRAQTEDKQGYEQAKSWLFAQGKHIDKSKIEPFSTALKLDKAALSACIDAPLVSAQINADMALAQQLGIQSTPSFVIGLQKEGVITDWKIITGAKNLAQFSQGIDQYLALAKGQDSATAKSDVE